MTEPVEIFYSYAHEDESLRKDLEKHLSVLQRQHLIAGWHDRKISAGQEWSSEIDTHFSRASIILLLVSSDFLNSDYCYSREMTQALEKQKTGQARAIPVILRPADWEETPLGTLEALPEGGKPITTWLNRDEAFLSVTQGIRTAVRELTTAPPSHHSSYARNNQLPLNQKLSSSSLRWAVANRQKQTLTTKHFYLLAPALVFILILVLMLERFPFGQRTPPPVSVTPTSITLTSVDSPLPIDTYSPVNTTLRVNDNFRGAIMWTANQGDAKIGQCAPKEDGYHISVEQPPYFQFCYAQNWTFTDLDYEVELKIVQGDCGALLFRADAATGSFYFFRICQDNSYQFRRYDTSDSLGQLLKESEPNESTNLQTGLGKTNLIAVSVQGSTFSLSINKQFIGSVNDPTYSDGQIGIAADCDKTRTEVIFSNVKVWTPA